MSENNYYAFISYSRDDIDAAKYIKRFLEHFKYPEDKVGPELRPENSKFLRKVFFDKTSLSGHKGDTFEQELQKKLAASRYLLVLCSPNSAKKNPDAEKHYVNWEIERFLEAHNNDYGLIVPVILDGEPDLSDESCLPSAIRREDFTRSNLPDMRPDRAELRKKNPDLKQNWENGVLTAISRLLDLEREEVKDTLHAEKLKQYKIYAVLALLIILVFAGLTLWALAAERRAVANEQRAIAGEKLARDKQKIADGTLNFMERIFQKTNPGTGGNKKITVLDAILHSEKEIETLEPLELRYSVFKMTGNILNYLSESREAVRFLESAIVLALQIYGNEHRETFVAYVELAEAQAKHGKLTAEAEKNYLKAIRIAENLVKLNPESAEYARDLSVSCNKLGNFCKSLGDGKKALEFYEKSIRIADDLVKQNPASADYARDLSVSCERLGDFYTALGDGEKALEFYGKDMKNDSDMIKRNQ